MDEKTAEIESASDFLNSSEHEATITSALRDELTQYTEALMEAKKQLSEAERAMEAAQKVYNDLARTVLPEILAKAHLTELRMEDGKIITVKEDLKCSIPKDAMKRAVCMEFLRSRGYADNIKQEVVITESDTQRVSQELLDMLTQAGISYDRTEDVHSQTLKKIMRELTGIGKGAFAVLERGDIPEEFGLFLFKEATIKG